MNNKGFTLVEILGAIVILGVIIALGFGVYTSVYDNQTQKTYENKVSMIELSAEKWATEANVSKNMTITVNRLVESSYFQADDYDSSLPAYIVNDPRDNSSMLCNTVDISIDNGEVVAKLNDVDNCDLKDEETDKAKVKIAAYEIDVATNKITKILKTKDSIVTSTGWSNKAILLAVEPDNEFASYKRVMFSSNGVSKEKNVNNNIMKLTNLKVGTVVNANNYANLYVVETNLFLKADYSVSVDVNGEGIKSNEITVMIDKEAPTTNVINETGWTKGSKKVTLRGTDGAGSGLKGFYVTTIGSGYTKKDADFKATDYEVKVELTTEGTYYAYAIDNVGNISSTPFKFEVINIDATAPTCEIEVSGQKGLNNYYTGNVTFKLIYSDSQSGVKTHNISATSLTTDKKDYKVTGEVEDNVGNVKTCSVTVSRDTTKPTVTTSVADADTWKNTNKTVTINLNDNVSGVGKYYVGTASSCSGVTYTSISNSNTTYKITPSYDNGTYRVCVIDNAGHEYTNTFTVSKIDKIAPSCGSTWSGQNTTWKKGAVTITNTPTDSGGSGVANSFTQTFSSGTMKTTNVSYTAKDNAGNTKACSATVNVYVDYDAPSCGSSWAGQSTSWTASNRTITNTPTDSGSGISNTFSQTFSSGTTKTTTVSYTAKDNVGNSRTCSSTVNVYVDKQGPTCGSSWGGQSTSWTSSNRTITNTPTDSGSGIKNTFSKTYSSGTTKTASVSYTATDNVGNTTSCSSTVNVYVDKDAPTCGSFSGQNTTWKNSAVTISSKASDSGSGTSSSFSKTYNSGTVSSTNVSYTATDAVGNSRTCSGTVNVYIDYDKPSCSITPSGTKGSNNWYTSNVTFTINKNVGSGSPVNTSKTTASIATLTSNTASHTVTATIYDTAGNYNTCSTTVKKDAGSPTISANQNPVHLDRGTSAAITSYFTAKNNLSGGSVTCKNASGSVVTNYNQLSFGSNNVTCTVTGNNGKTASATIRFAGKYAANLASAVVYKQCSNSACGNGTAKSCANSSCSCASYNSQANESVCGCASQYCYLYKSCTRHKCGYGGWSYDDNVEAARRDCPAEYRHLFTSEYGQFAGCGSEKVYGSRCDGKSSRVCETANTCSNSSFGCASYNSCQNGSACGYNYASCRVPACGVEKDAVYNCPTKGTNGETATISGTVCYF